MGEKEKKRQPFFFFFFFFFFVLIIMKSNPTEMGMGLRQCRNQEGQQGIKLERTESRPLVCSE